jgi:hypothetical protein
VHSPVTVHKSHGIDIIAFYFNNYIFRSFGRSLKGRGKFIRSHSNPICQFSLSNRGYPAGIGLADNRCSSYLPAYLLTPSPSFNSKDLPRESLTGFLQLFSHSTLIHEQFCAFNSHINYPNHGSRTPTLHTQLLHHLHNNSSQTHSVHYVLATFMDLRFQASRRKAVQLASAFSYTRRRSRSRN